MLISPEDAAAAAHEYVSEGWTVAEWLHDNAIQCECCQNWFQSEADFDTDVRVYCDSEGREWVCQECASFNRTPEGARHHHPQYHVLHPHRAPISNGKAAA